MKNKPFSKYTEQCVTLTLYCCYRATQNVLNKTAKTLMGKTHKNENQPFFANQDFYPLPHEVDYKSYTAPLKMNYSEVPYFHQPRVFDCADTSIKMMLGFHKNKCNETKYLSQMQIIKDFEDNFYKKRQLLFSGKSAFDLTQYSPALIVENLSRDEITANRLAYLLYRNGPLLVSICEIGGHFSVIKGVINNQVIVHDPWRGPNHIYSFDEYKKKLDGTFIYFSSGYSKALEFQLERLENSRRNRL